jgi:transcriptional regulator of arginine metabolism
MASPIKKQINNVTARKAKVVALVESGLIHSQIDLVRELKKAGFSVTQATASRDLEEIGAVRGSGGYRLGANSDDALARVLNNDSLILSIESSGNLAVVRTPPGAAQLLASSLDHSGMKSIIGTIAGDDTVLVVSRKANGGAQLAKELLADLREKRAVKKRSAGRN